MVLLPAVQISIYPLSGDALVQVHMYGDLLLTGNPRNYPQFLLVQIHYSQVAQDVRDKGSLISRTKQ